MAPRSLLHVMPAEPLRRALGGPSLGLCGEQQTRNAPRYGYCRGSIQLPELHTLRYEGTRRVTSPGFESLWQRCEVVRKSIKRWLPIDAGLEMHIKEAEE